MIPQINGESSALFVLHTNLCFFGMDGFCSMAEYVGAFSERRTIHHFLKGG